MFVFAKRKFFIKIICQFKSIIGTQFFFWPLMFSFFSWRLANYCRESETERERKTEKQARMLWLGKRFLYCGGCGLFRKN